MDKRVTMVMVRGEFNKVEDIKAMEVVRVTMAMVEVVKADRQTMAMVGEAFTRLLLENPMRWVFKA